MQWRRRTLGDQVPPGAVERVVRAPARDVRAVRLTRAVLELERRAELRLPVERGERGDVRHPAVVAVSNGGSKPETADLRVGVEDVEGLVQVFCLSADVRKQGRNAQKNRSRTCGSRS